MQFVTRTKVVRATNYLKGHPMHAAVVRSFDQPPRYETVETPQARREHKLVVDVLAAGLHPRVRSSADGTHYTSTDELPLIPGIDGVGRAPDGDLVYFVLPDTTLGAMAEQTAVDRRRSVALPADSDVARIAAAMNPAMSSWVALRTRIAIGPGQRVLVLGATGNAGQMAVEIAKHLGAGDVIGAGRDAERLAALADLGADVTISLDREDAYDALGDAAAGVDIVIDYLWGTPAEHAIRALVTRRHDRSRPLDWIQIGSVAGPDITLPSAALRAANLRIMGSGHGSVTTAAIIAQLPALAAEITAGTLTVNAAPVPLSQVETAWNAPTAPGQRIVFTP
jgi:NADPH:quinone reductase-like Zn-dependent oxidoreductase